MKLKRMLKWSLGYLNLATVPVVCTSDGWLRLQMPIPRKDLDRNAVYIFARRREFGAPEIQLEARWEPELGSYHMDPEHPDSTFNFDYTKNFSRSDLYDEARFQKLEHKGFRSLALVWDCPERPGLARLWGGVGDEIGATSEYLVGACTLCRGRRQLLSALIEARSVLSVGVGKSNRAEVEVPVVA